MRTQKATAALLAGAISLSSVALPGCKEREKGDAEIGPQAQVQILNGVNAPAVDPSLMESAGKQMTERGYADVGQGVFVVLNDFHASGDQLYKVGNCAFEQLRVAKAIANFRQDHPDLKITNTIDLRPIHGAPSGIVLITTPTAG